MPDYDPLITAFVHEAAQALDQASQNIGQLAARAYHSYDTLIAQQSPPTDPRWEHLAQVARQLEKLIERNTRLSRYLSDGMLAPPEDDELWPRIRIIQSQEEERSRLARELEESVGQLLANAVFELASCRSLLDTQNPAVEEGLAALKAELERGVSDVRQLIADLDPPSFLGTLGLAAGLRRYMESFEERTGIQSVLRAQVTPQRLPTTVEVAIFRIIQEGLENVRRHAQADRVEVDIYEEDKALVVCLTDNGIGLQPQGFAGRRRGLGIVSMRERAELLGGTLRVRSDVEQGTQLMLSVPYPLS